MNLNALQSDLIDLQEDSLFILKETLNATWNFVKGHDLRNLAAKVAPLLPLFFTQTFPLITLSSYNFTIIRIST